MRVIMHLVRQLICRTLDGPTCMYVCTILQPIPLYELLITHVYRPYAHVA